MYNDSKINLLIQFSLLVAGQEEDYRDRSLGPIHLLKYVYLADLFYAAAHEGETFTGIDWEFYKFGPWSYTVHNRIEPALAAINADHRILDSHYEDQEDYHRWSLVDDSLYQEFRNQLPFQIVCRLEHAIHTYGPDTPRLLDFVYNTAPMRKAAPHEHLDFKQAVKTKPEKVEFEPLMSRLSAKKKKKLKNRIKEFQQQRASTARTHWKDKLKKPPTPPRYDDVYDGGLQWLDSLAGPAIPTGKIEVTFDDSVWKSSTRTSDEVS